jgi:hypothetical protein
MEALVRRELRGVGMIAELDFWLKLTLVAAVCVAIFLGSRRD